MASSSSTYLLPGPTSLIGSKSMLIKQSPPNMLHPIHHPFHSLTIPNMNHNNDDTCGSNGHSLSQSMESINNIGLPDDEVN